MALNPTDYLVPVVTPTLADVQVFTKHPNEQVEVPFNWTDVVNGITRDSSPVTLATQNTTVSTGINKDNSPAIDGDDNRVVVLIGGGSADSIYWVRQEVTFSNGQKRIRFAKIQVLAEPTL